MLPGPTELILILIILLLIFGASRIPQLGEALGKGIKNFRKATSPKDDAIDITPTRESIDGGDDGDGGGDGPPPETPA